MDYQEILLSAKLLSSADQARLILDLVGQSQEDYLSYRRPASICQTGSISNSKCQFNT